MLARPVPKSSQAPPVQTTSVSPSTQEATLETLVCAQRTTGVLRRRQFALSMRRHRSTSQSRQIRTLKLSVGRQKPTSHLVWAMGTFRTSRRHRESADETRASHTLVTAQPRVFLVQMQERRHLRTQSWHPKTRLHSSMFQDRASRQWSCQISLPHRLAGGRCWQSWKTDTTGYRFHQQEQPQRRRIHTSHKHGDLRPCHLCWRMAR